MVMGFSVPDFKTRGTIIPCRMIEVSTMPDRIGVFRFLCDLFCWSGRESLEGTMRVVAKKTGQTSAEVTSRREMVGGVRVATSLQHGAKGA